MIECIDELDILGYFFEGNFPLPEENDESTIYAITGFTEEMDKYFNGKLFGHKNVVKPVRETPPTKEL